MQRIIIAGRAGILHDLRALQVLDDDGPAYKGKLKPYQYSGGLYHFQGPSKAMYKGAGQWNAFELTCKGDQVTLVYNGEKVIDDGEISGPTGAALDNKALEPGPILLQGDHGKVSFRNVRIKPAK